MKNVDLVDVMIAVHKGELKVVVHNGFFLLENTKSGERVRLNEADVSRTVHGKWVALDDDCEELEDETEALRWGCTACHENVEYDDWTHRSRLTRFCPNCGAKMDGDGNG